MRKGDDRISEKQAETNLAEPAGAASGTASETNDAGLETGTESGTGIGWRIVSVLRTVFVYLLAIGIIVGAVLFAADRSPQKSLFGYRYYTVLTPSMTPTYDAGDMVFVKVLSAEEKAEGIAPGDVITFNPSSDGEAYLTHRVTEVLPDYQGTGVTCFRTKGDANNTEDAFLIDQNRVIGTVRFGIPKLGDAVRFVQLRWYFVAGLIVLLGIFFRLLRLYFAPPDSKEPDTSDTANETGKHADMIQQGAGEEAASGKGSSQDADSQEPRNG
ncbi:MAG: signal peptidase I [Oscillospiraceae bacterium]|nr:signal peptidase I [Oscillospiraceae bacterium]